MTPSQYGPLTAKVRAALQGDERLLRPPVQGLVQEVLEAEMDKALGAGR